MEKVIRFTPIFLFIAFCIKLLIFGGSWIDASIVVTIASLFFSHEYLLKTNEIQAFQKNIEGLITKNEQDLLKLSDKFAEQIVSFKEAYTKQEKEINEIKSYLSNVKVREVFKR